MKNNSKYSLVTLLLLLVSLTVNATNFTVNSLADTNTGAGTSGTLRWCMNQANLSSGPHTITFDLGLSGGTINLTSNLPVIGVPNVTIDGIGDGSANIIIDGGGGDIARYIFRANAIGDFTTFRNFIVQNTGYGPFQLVGSPTDITIENIVTFNSGGNFLDYTISFQGNATNLTVTNVTQTDGQVGFYGIYISGTSNNVVIDGFNFSDGDPVIGIYFGGAAANVTISNSVLDLSQIGSASTGDYGIRFNSTASNITLNNNTVTNADLYALLFNNTTTTIGIDGFNFINDDGGTTVFGMRFVGVANGITMANVTLDLDHIATTDDGDYGIYFNTTASTISLDNITMHDTERNGLLFGGVLTDFSLTNSDFDNFDGWGNNEMIRFNNVVNGITMTNVTIDADVTGSIDDGNTSIYFLSEINQDDTKNAIFTNLDLKNADSFQFLTSRSVNNFTVENSTFTGNTEANTRGEGLDLGFNFTKTDILINNNTFLNLQQNGILIDTDGTNGTSNIKITNNTISGTTANGSFAGNGIIIWEHNGITQLEISGNTLFNNAATGITITHTDGINVSQNNIYNNPIGIDNATNNGNNDLERLDGDTPRMLSSVDVGGGNFDVTFNLPAFCTNCDIEFFTNQVGDSNNNGRNYRSVAVGLSGVGPHTVTVNAGGATDGFWTTTLKDINQNSSVSEFSGSVAINPQGPANVDAGIALWARADISGQADGNFTAGNEWIDFSGNGNNYGLTVSSDPELVSNVINFNRSVVFDGNDYLSQPNANLNVFPSANDDRTVFIVSKITATSNETAYSYGSTGGSQNQSWRYENGTIRYIGWANDFTGAGTFIVNEPFIGRYDHDGTTASINSDGRQVITSPRTYNTNISAGTSHIGVREGAGGEAFIGDISEVIVFNRNLTALEKSRIESYLALKYGITLDQTIATNYVASDGTILWDATVNNFYTNDVTGIGRDDNGFFNQKQSKSINTDNIVTIGLGEIAIDNPTNANTFAADKNFLIWGNDNVSTALQTTELPATAAAVYRLGREWKVAETGSVSNLTIAFSGISASIDLELYIDTDGDGDFTNATVITGGTVTGSVATFVGVDLNDGNLFTLGYTQVAPGGVLTGLDFWLDPSVNVTTSGASVTQWSDRDLSGNNPILGQGTAALQPTFNAGNAASNFNPYIDFITNTRLHQTVTGSTYAKSHSIFAAYHNNQAAPGSVYAHFIRFASASNSDAGSHRWGFGYNTYPGVNSVGIHYITAPFSPGTITLPLDQYNQYNVSKAWSNDMTGIVSATIDQAGSQTIMGFDGDESINNLAINNAGLTPMNFLTLGGGNTYGQRGWGLEIIEYSVALSQIDRQKVNTYLAIKYGATLAHNYLASDASVIWDVTANAIYSNDIAGIARDDNGVLNQKQSRSISTDAIVTIGLGSIDATNAANANTFTADKNFLIWGNDNASTSIQNTELPATAAALYRMGREWKVSETGAVSNLTIAFANVPFTAYDIELFVDTDGNGDFTNATVITGGTISGGVATFTGVDLNNNDSFTIGFTAASPGGVVAGLNLWLRADLGTTPSTTGTLTNWEDVAQSNNATQFGARPLPSVIDGSATLFNFNKAIEFTATDQKIGNITSTTLGTTNYDIFSFTKEGMSGNRVLNIGRNNTIFNGTNWDTPAISASNTILHRRVSDGALVYASNPGGAFNASIPSITYNRFTNTSVTKGYNGANTGGVGNFAAIGSPLGGYILGDNRSTGTGGDDVGFIGTVGEFIAYNRNLTATERRQVDSYMAIKYGLSLDVTVAVNNYLMSDASVIWDATVNATYNNDIAGIGRDDLSVLNQKQSKSVNAGAIVTIGLGSINATNAANVNAFTADKDFLVWGNDNVSTAVVNTGIPSSFSEKIIRNWLVNETGAVGNTLVQIPNSAVAGFTNTTALQLFVADDAGFTTNLIAIPLVQNGANWEATVDFNGVKYFTFGIVASGDFMRHGKTFQGGTEQPMKF